MKIGPSKAAQLARVARSTIYKDIEEGKLSAEQDGKGRPQLEVAAGEVEKDFRSGLRLVAAGQGEDLVIQGDAVLASRQEGGVVFKSRRRPRRGRSSPPAAGYGGAAVRRRTRPG